MRSAVSASTSCRESWTWSSPTLLQPSEAGGDRVRSQMLSDWCRARRHGRLRRYQPGRAAMRVLHPIDGPAAHPSRPLHETRAPTSRHPVRRRDRRMSAGSSNRDRREGNDASARPEARVAREPPPLHPTGSSKHPLRHEFHQHVVHVALDLRAIGCVKRSKFIDDLADGAACRRSGAVSRSPGLRSRSLVPGRAAPMRHASCRSAGARPGQGADAPVSRSGIGALRHKGAGWDQPRRDV